VAIHILQQLTLAPRDRCELRHGKIRKRIVTEDLPLVDPSAYPAFVDVLFRTLYVAGKPVKVPPGPMKLLLRLLLSGGKALTHKAVQGALDASGAASEATSKAALKALTKALKGSLELDVKITAKGVTATPPESLAMLVPVWLAHNGLTDGEKAVLKLLRKRGSASMLDIQEQCELSRAVARRDVAALTKAKLVEPAREGRGQVYRLA
ncbi:MAG TPA: hypothetical protein VFH51_05920, partial [Myxococcota bacterium]|nr:hypothetical protein [Myxococcota bacterium]